MLSKTNETNEETYENRLLCEVCKHVTQSSVCKHVTQSSDSVDRNGFFPFSE